jgi:hypothetical protein
MIWRPIHPGRSFKLRQARFFEDGSMTMPPMTPRSLRAFEPAPMALQATEEVTSLDGRDCLQWSAGGKVLTVFVPTEVTPEEGSEYVDFLRLLIRRVEHLSRREILRTAQAQLSHAAEQGAPQRGTSTASDTAGASGAKHGDQAKPCGGARGTPAWNEHRE